MIINIDVDNIEENVLIVDKMNKIINVNTFAKNNNMDIFVDKDISEIFYHNISYDTIKVINTHIILNEKKIYATVVRKFFKEDYTLCFIRFAVSDLYHNTKFMANLSHEIRTPLNGIIGTISLLNETLLDQEQKSYMNILKESGNNLIRIVSDILDFSSLESGNLKLSNKNFYLKDCIESAINIVKYKAIDKNITIEYDIVSDVPEYILSDSQRIKQILINLYYNSIKYSPKNSKVTTLVSLEKYYEKDNNYTLKFSVKDCGCGIDEKDVDRLFKSYTRLHSSQDIDTIEGTGLGLSISKELTALLEGNIWVESSILGKGSDFCFTVKVKKPEDSNLIKYSPLLEGKIVLIISSDDKLRLNTCTILLKHKLIAYPVSNPREAIIFFKGKITFDIIILDYRVCPEYISFCNKIREESQNVNFVLLYQDSLDDRYSLISEYLKIPVKESKLLGCINDIITEQKENYIERISIDSTDNIKILIDEDLYTNQLILSIMLKKLGYTNIQVAENGQEALNIIENDTIDICFVDLKTPIMSGLELIDKLKEKKVYRPYCVAFTAMVADTEYYLNYGFDDFLFKPVYIEKVNEVMGRFLNNLNSLSVD